MAVLSRLSPSLSFGIRLGSLPELLAKWWSVAAVGGGALYFVTKVLYRRFFSPTCKRPRPVFACGDEAVCLVLQCAQGGQIL